VPGRGLGLAAFAGYDIGAEDLIDRPDTDTRSAAALNDYAWGGGPPAVTQIPYSWLSQPLRFRPDTPINVAAVTQANGTPAVSTNAVSVAAYGEFTSSPITLSTICDADPANLAAHLTGNYADPRQRCPQVTLNLLERTALEMWLILGRFEGDRIQITGAPADWPVGTTSLLIEGIQHTGGVDDRVVVWNTSPVIGSTPGIPGPWFRTDSSRLDGADRLPF
jgi:hypothetical protein